MSYYQKIYDDEDGTVFTKDDVSGMVALLTKVIWNQSLTDPRFTNLIDGTNDTIFFRQNSSREPWNNGLVYSGWVMLSQYDPTTFLAMDATLKAILLGQKNPSLSYNGTFHGRLAISGHLAKAAWHRQNSVIPPTIKKADEK